MKKLIIALLAIVTLASCKQAKLGVVNTEKLITEYQETIDTEAAIKEKDEKSKKDLEILIQSFQAKVADYQKKAPKMSSKKRGETEQMLGAEQQMIQQKQQQAQYAVQNEGQQEIKKIAEKVNKFIRDYGKTNGYQIIFGTVNLNGAVMYNEDQIDLTDTILTALNDAYKGGNSVKEETKTEEVKEESKKVEEKKEDTKK